MPSSKTPFKDSSVRLPPRRGIGQGTYLPGKKGKSERGLMCLGDITQPKVGG